MSDFCYSCTAPLSSPEFQGAAADYCKYCTDEAGNLKSRDDVQQGIAEWMKTWQPNLDDAKAARRADLFMQSMPAWAGD